MRHFLFALLCSTVSLWAEALDVFPQSSRLLAIDAYQRRPLNENYLFSPLSASSCLSMAIAGANGATADELCQTLHLDLSPRETSSAFHQFLNDFVHEPKFDRDFQLELVQGVWSQIGFSFLDSFMQEMREKFLAEIESIDFTPLAVDKINRWAANHTAQKIQNLLNVSDITSQTRLVLANALYFKGVWIKPFYPHNTLLAPFSSIDGEKEVEMMRQVTRFPYFEDSDWQAVLLRFVSDSSSIQPACLLVLSKKPQVSPSIPLDAILDSLESRTIDLQVPKFKLEERMDLSGLLKELGAARAFSSEADFSKMDGRCDLFISRVLQKCFFSFGENGVEAAAATAAVMNLSACPCEATASMHLNRPFAFFLIDEKTKTCLMTGHVANPE